MKKLVFLLPLLMLVGCKSDPLVSNYDVIGIFNGLSPKVDTRFAESMTYNEEHGMPGSLVNVNDDYVLYVMTDTHVDSTTRNVRIICHAAQMDEHCPMVIHLGDMVNAQYHYPDYCGAVSAELTKPIVQTAGNHDICFGQWPEYKKHFGTSTYTFTITTKSGAVDWFICLDSSSGTLGKKQMKWLRSQLKEAAKAGYRHRVLYTHTHIFKQDASQGHTTNYCMEETYELLGLMQQYGIELVMMGHDHSREITSYGGVRYIIVDSAQDPQEKPYYMLLSMGEKITYDFVALPGKVGGLK